jgi:signal peptidase I
MNEKEEIKEELWCEALNNGNIMRYKALGRSMSPFIKNGSILTVDPKRKISIGDVILWRKDGGMIAHRVIRKRKSGKGFIFVTKGDNLIFPDEPVYMFELLGKVVRVEGEGDVDMNSLSSRLFNYAIAVASMLFLSKALSILRRIKYMVHN